MPVFIDQPDAFERICQVEREIEERYGQPGDQENFGPCGFYTIGTVAKRLVR